MIKYLLLFTLIFSIPNTAKGNCPNVAPIIQGQPAPCDGFYFSDEAEKKAAQARDDAEFFKKINEQLTRKSTAQEKENEILERRLNLYMKQSDVLAKEVASRDNMDGLYRFGYFALGVLVTGFIAANVSR